MRQALLSLMALLLPTTFDLGDATRLRGVLGREQGGTGGTTGDGSVPNFADGETPAGLMNGSNTTFTLAHTPTPAASLVLFLNGIRQQHGNDFTLTGPVITTVLTPASTHVLSADYRY